MNPQEELYYNLLMKKKLRGLDDLFFFNKYILEQSEDRRKFLVPHVHKEWAEWLKNSIKRIKLLLVPRSCFKTTFVTVGYILQQIAKNRNIRILIANATLSNAMKFLDEIKWHLINNKEYLMLYGDYDGGSGFYDKNLKWNESEIVVAGRTITSQTPTITTTGVGGNLVSQHYDLIIDDDLINLENSATKVQADKVIEWWKKSHSLLEPGGEMLLLGTRWAYYELYQYILDKMMDKVDILKKSIYNPDGTFYFPERFSDAVIKDLKILHGAYSFSAFYLNDPVDDDAAIIKQSMIKYYGENEEVKLPKVLNIFSLSDPAVSQSTEADYSVILTVGIDSENNWYVLEIKREKYTTGEYIEELFIVFKKWSPITMSIEVIGQAQGIMESIRNAEESKGIFLPLFEIKARPQITKEMRIRSVLQPRFENKKVYIKREMDELEFELLKFPVAPHDDIIDALTDTEEIGFVPDSNTPPLEQKASYFENQLVAHPKKEKPVDDVMGEMW
jgi:phage terminase large subunit-like protein